MVKEIKILSHRRCKIVECGAMMLFFISEKYIHVFLVVSGVFGVI
jgi:hypothetical protein